MMCARFLAQPCKFFRDRGPQGRAAKLAQARPARPAQAKPVQLAQARPAHSPTGGPWAGLVELAGPGLQITKMVWNPSGILPAGRVSGPVSDLHFLRGLLTCLLVGLLRGLLAGRLTDVCHPSGILPASFRYPSGILPVSSQRAGKNACP